MYLADVSRVQLETWEHRPSLSHVMYMKVLAFTLRSLPIYKEDELS